MKWQGKIFDRDDYTCQMCNKTKDDNIVLCMHHINYIKTDFRDDNLITLCMACNNKSTWDRENYKETLTQKVNKILSTKSLPVGVGLSSKEYTKIVLERDNNTCKICGRSEDMVLRVHRIDDSLDFVEDNLITLCSTCNTNKIYRRKEFWKKTLSDIVKGVISPTINELYALEQSFPVEVEKKAFGIGTTKRNQWRDKIFARDNNSCIVCKTTEKQLLMKQVNLQKDDFRDENLVVLCRTCESKLVKNIDNIKELITEYLNQVL
jgi:5-methylcytosine-specific restriction endonuclease McrA